MSRDVPDPVPGAGQALVRTLACGICGSDLHMLKHGAAMQELGEELAKHAPPEPDARRCGWIPRSTSSWATSSAREVLDVGPDCSNLKTGDVVVSMPVAFDPGGLHAVGYSNQFPGGYGELMLLNDLVAMKVPNGIEPSTRRAHRAARRRHPRGREVEHRSGRRRGRARVRPGRPRRDRRAHAARHRADRRVRLLAGTARARREDGGARGRRPRGRASDGRMATRRRRAAARHLRGCGRARHDRPGDGDGAAERAHPGRRRVHGARSHPPDGRHRPRAQHPVRLGLRPDRVRRRARRARRGQRRAIPRSSRAPSASTACRRRSSTSATPRPTPRSSWSRRQRPRPWPTPSPASTRAPAGSRSASLANFMVSPDGNRIVFVRSGAGDDPVNGLWVFDVDSGEESPRRRCLRSPRQPPTPTSPRRSAPAASGLESRPAASSRSRPIDEASSPRLRSRAGCSRSTCSPAPRVRSRPRDRCSIRGPIRRASVSPTSRVGRSASPTSTDTDADHRGPRPERVVGVGRVHRRRGDGPHPRLLVVARRRSRRGVPRRHHERRPLASDRSSRSVGHAQRARLSGGRDDQRRRRARGDRSRRRDEVPRMGSRDLSVPRLGAVERRRAAHVPRAVARPAIDAGARGRYDVARDTCRRGRPRSRVGRARARVPRVGGRAVS